LNDLQLGKAALTQQATYTIRLEEAEAEAECLKEFAGD
jgi:hypothetical protein